MSAARRTDINGAEWTRIESEFGAATERNVNGRWFDVLQFSTMLNLCLHTGLIALDENDCRTLRNIRNRVMHEVKLLIDAPEDIFRTLLCSVSR